MARTRDIRLNSVVKAAPGRVYAALTRPAEVRRWWMSKLTGRPASGGKFRLEWREAEPGVYPPALGEVRGVFLDLEPGRKVAWLSRDCAGNGGTSALVSFFITPMGRGAEVSLSHCGFGPGRAGELRYRGFLRGWTDALARLKRHVEGARRKRL